MNPKASADSPRAILCRFFYGYRGYLVALPVIFSLVWFRWEVETIWTWPVGLCLFLLGFGIRVWAQQHLHYRLKVHKNLTLTGPYVFVRNPIYIGNISICLGLTVCSELLWFVPVTMFYCWGLYSFVVRYEESHLLAKYGEPYREYMEEVPRWYPRLSRSGNKSLVTGDLLKSVIVELHSLIPLVLVLIKELIDA